MRFSTVTFRFTNQWVLDVKRAAKNLGKAKSEILTREEFHGDLERAVAGAKRYLGNEDKATYQALYAAMAKAIRIFRAANTFDFHNKVQWSVTTPDGQNSHRVQTNKNHGAVRMVLVVGTDHHLSKGDTTQEESFPGNHEQAARAMLSRDVGEYLKAHPRADVDSVIAFLRQRVESIEAGMKAAVTADYAGDDEREEAA